MFSLNLYKSGESLKISGGNDSISVIFKGARMIGGFLESEYELSEKSPQESREYGSHFYRCTYGKFLVRYPNSLYLRKKIIMRNPRMFLYLPIRYKTVGLCLFMLRNFGPNFFLCKSKYVEYPDLPRRLLANEKIFEYVKHIPYYQKLKSRYLNTNK